MRYSLQLPRTEKYDRQGAFLPELAKEFPIPQPCAACRLPNGRVVTSALVIPFGYAGRGGRSRYIFPASHTNFEPRFGFAYVPKLFGWNARGRMVFRGGYGLSHAPLTGMNRNPSPDFASGTTAFNTIDNRLQFPGTNIVARLCCNKPVITPQAPETFLNIPQDGLVYLNSINIPAFSVSPNTHVPYVQSWNATVAFELPQSTMVELSYVGAKGTHLFLPPINLNPIPFDVTAERGRHGALPVRAGLPGREVLRLRQRLPVVRFLGQQHTARRHRERPPASGLGAHLQCQLHVRQEH
jgi:hypothetical protein